MTNNLSNFAELMKQAAREKQFREEAENERKLREVAPSLTELFQTVKKAKELANTEEAEKKEKVIELVKSLEEQLETNENTPRSDDQEAGNTQVTDDVEKRFKSVLERIQKDFQSLRKYIDNRMATPTTVSFGGGGSGEVQITRMDDVEGTPSDGEVLAWSSAKNKFIYTNLPVGGVSEEEVPYSKRVDFVSDSVTYKGEAAVGSLETDPVWRIRKVIIGTDGDVTEIWANGTASFSHEWADRLLYVYS